MYHKFSQQLFKTHLNRFNGQIRTEMNQVQVSITYFIVSIIPSTASQVLKVTDASSSPAAKL